MLAVCKTVCFAQNLRKRYVPRVRSLFPFFDVVFTYNVDHRCFSCNLLHFGMKDRPDKVFETRFHRTCLVVPGFRGFGRNHGMLCKIFFYTESNQTILSSLLANILSTPESSEGQTKSCFVSENRKCRTFIRWVSDLFENPKNSPRGIFT